MVGGWIPFDKSLPEKPEVLDISAHTGLTIAEVILSLMRFWSWMDDHSNDGIIKAQSVRILSALCPQVPGTFWEAMVLVGWLEVGADFVRCVNFEKYISKSAKRRLSESRRKMENRHNNNILTQMSASDADTMRTPTRQISHLPTPTPTPTEKEEGEGESPSHPPAKLVADELVQEWNRLDLVRAIKLTPKRMTALKARLKDGFWRDNWKAALERVAKSSFARGENDRGWKMDLDKFLAPGTVMQIMEGKYDDRPKKPVGRDRPGRIEPEPGKYDGIM